MYRRTQLYMPNLNGSLVIAIKPKYEETFRKP
jgi:hypothetical protein